MQVINPELLVPSNSSLPANPERPGDGLFDAILREEEARYQETRQRDIERDEDYRPHEHRENGRYDERRSDDGRSEDRGFEEDRRVDRRDDNRVEPDRDDGDRLSGDGERPLAADTQRGEGRPDAEGASQDHITDASRDLAGSSATVALATPLTQPAHTPAGVAWDGPKAILANPVAGLAAQRAGRIPGAIEPNALSQQPNAAVKPAAAPVTTSAANTRNDGSLPNGTQTASSSDLSTGPLQGRTDKTSAAELAKTKAPTADAIRSNLAAQPGLTTDRPTVNTPATSGGQRPLEDVLVTTGNTGLSSRPSTTLGGNAATAALVAEAKPQTSSINSVDRAKAKTAVPTASVSDATPKSGLNENKAQMTVGADSKGLIAKNDLPAGLSAASLQFSGDGVSIGGGGASLTAVGSISNGFSGGLVQNTAFAETLTAARGNTAAAPAEQIAVQVQKAQQAGRDQINIKLHPAELGRIEVKLENGDDGILRAVISAEKSETLDLLQRDARGLEKALQEAGVKTDSGSLSFNLKGQQQPGQERPEGQSTSHAEAHDMSQDDNTAPPPPPPAVALHDGALDIRV